LTVEVFVRRVSRRAVPPAKEAMIRDTVKLVELRPSTQEHDRNTKTRTARRLLEEGYRVKISVRYRGRERTHPERARSQLDAIVEALDDVARALQAIREDPRSMSVVLGPKKT
jgi:translation initiation factor IF-3